MALLKVSVGSLARFTGQSKLKARPEASWLENALVLPVLLLNYKHNYLAEMCQKVEKLIVIANNHQEMIYLEYNFFQLIIADI